MTPSTPQVDSAHSALLELAKRVEAATSPQQHLFISALELTHPKPPSGYQPRGNPEFAPGFVAWAKLDAQVRNFCQFGAFFDAAMTLVPDGWKLRQMNFSAPCADDREWHLNLHGGKIGRDCFVGRGKVPALALLAASLRASATPTPA